MSNRIITSRARGSSVQLVDYLGSLFVLELLKPSKELYLISPWLSKVPLIDNRFGQFRALASELDKPELHLGEILTLLATRGTQVRILYRTPTNESTSQFLESVQNVKNIECRVRQDLHEKGLITSHFYVCGSMNFTYAGVHLNDESIVIINDEGIIWQALQEAKMSWEGAKVDDTHKL